VRAKTASRVAWSLWALTPVSLAAGVILGLATDTFRADAFIVLIPAFLLAFATVGALVASRHPRNAIGWIFLATSVAWGLTTVADSYAIYAKLSGNTGSTLARVSDWVNLWFYGPAIFLPVTLLLLLFPEGRLPSHRWRPFLWLGVIGNVGITLAEAFGSSSADVEDAKFLTENPFEIEALAPVLGTVAAVSWFLGAVALLAALAAIVVRFRRSRGDERQQMKWVAYAGIVIVLVLVAQGIAGAAIGWGEFGPVAKVVVPAMILSSLTLIPLAAGAAILKHRLYDIDVVINKTVVYGLLAALVTMIYVAIVVGVGTGVGAGGSPFLSAVAAAIVALAFQPARRWAQHLANRLVYGRRATPYEVLSGFSGRVAASYSVDDILPRMARVIAEGTGASRSRVWLSVGGRLRQVASWPLEDMPTPDAHSVDELPDLAFEVRHQGELLGAITVTMPASEPITAAAEQLIGDLAAQAGLVLRNVRLIEELRESRRRIVAAQDERAKKLERDIHDGAQQQLVALSVKLGLAERLVRADAEKAAEMLAEAKAETGEALENLRDLARGIYPPLLADEGLAAALDAQARKAPLPVRVEADGVGRYPEEMEAAVYFSCLEALQNVAKYAEASAATIGLAHANGHLFFEVTDDGRGFDPDAAERGSGLQGIADRLAALGGELTLRSSPGNGTTVAGRLPIGGTPP
jgi:signal transduction histidine kinase